MVDLSAQTEAEMEAIRNAVVQKEGLLLSVFDVLRRVPRRVLMVLKLNDLTRCAFHLENCSVRRQLTMCIHLTGVSTVRWPRRMRTYGDPYSQLMHADAMADRSEYS